ncbi:MAG: iron ABC transporter substrate-binding protein [Rhizobiales bacterium 65-9]|nr:iron ABC transporter substrate-binding protein [Hyphomicrobiales bacterium]OJY36127.1 MAG: iron ABC transporter substrate-binding protein [Rhizobiales bacterium 65-9]
MRHVLSRAAVVSALFAAAAAWSAPSFAQGEQGIVVYNAQHAGLAQAWADGFTKETGIKVTLRKGSDLEFANQIIQEGAASPADVFLTENSPGLVLVDKAGLFAPINPDTLALVSDAYKPANGHWTGVAARSTVFAYNKTKLSPDKLPKSMLDLADPSWKGRWAASPSGADFQAIVGALLELKGEAATASWLKAMKENFKPYRGNAVAMRAVNNGEVDGAVIYHYYFVRDQAKTAENSGNVALHYFRNQDPGAFVSISGAGVLASSKNKPQAQAFIKWVAGKGGQTVLQSGGTFEYAVGAGAESSPKLEPLSKLDAPKVDASKLDSKKVTELMTAAGLL